MGLYPIFHKIFSGVLALTNLTRLVDFFEKSLEGRGSPPDAFHLGAQG
jgi:hypothetical protein